MPGGVWLLGFVSMLMDISSEMVHSLPPLFMVTALGSSALSAVTKPLFALATRHRGRPAGRHGAAFIFYGGAVMCVLALATLALRPGSMTPG